MVQARRHSKVFLALLLSLATIHLFSIYYSVVVNRSAVVTDDMDHSELSYSKTNTGASNSSNNNLHSRVEDDDDSFERRHDLIGKECSNQTTGFLKTISDNISMEKSRETAVIIPTHLVPSHPSLDLLVNTVDSIRKYLFGLHPKAPIIITVDNLLEDNPRNRGENGLLLLLNEENRHKLELYLKALYKEFAVDEHVRILVSGKGIGLAENLKKAVDVLHPETKYIYIVQQDLPFVATINHTAIVKVVEENPQLVRIVRFNNYGAVSNVYNCDEPNVVKEINAHGITLKKFKKWSDQNHFATVEHYKKDVFPNTGGKVFPEARLQQKAFKNCTFYGPYYYFEANRGGPWYEHVDGTERYGEKLAERLRNGELDITLLSKGNLKDLERSRINMTELFELNQKKIKTDRNS